MIPAPRERRLSVLVSAVAVLVSVAATVLALVTASGVTPVGPDTYETEFADGALLAVNWATPVALAVAAWWWGVPAAVGVVAVGATTFAGTVVTVRRYADSGWGDGLEYLGFALPLGLLVLGAVAVGVTVAVRRSRRPRPA